MNRKRLLPHLLLAAVAGFWSGCAPGSPRRAASGTPGESHPSVGVSVLTLTNPFYRILAESFAAEAAPAGYEVFVVSAEFDVARQQDQVMSQFIGRGVAAIVLTPCDSTAVGPAIQAANAAGIPVFTIDSACVAPEVEVATHIATDNHAGGREAAKAMIEALGPGAYRVAILHQPALDSCARRVLAFEEVLAQHNAEALDGGIEVVAVVPCGGVRARAIAVTAELLEAEPDLAGIFAINDPAALGAIEALEQAGRTNVVLIGFDAQFEGKQAILAGKIHADPVQFPDRIGIEAARAVVRHLAGEPTDKEILIPTALYRRSDAEDDPGLR